MTSQNVFHLETSHIILKVYRKKKKKKKSDEKQESFRLRKGERNTRKIASGTMFFKL